MTKNITAQQLEQAVFSINVDSAKESDWYEILKRHDIKFKSVEGTQVQYRVIHSRPDEDIQFVVQPSKKLYWLSSNGSHLKVKFNDVHSLVEYLSNE